MDLDMPKSDDTPVAAAAVEKDGKEDDHGEVAKVPLTTPQNSFMLSDAFDFDTPPNDGTAPNKASKKEVAHGGTNQQKGDDVFAHY